MKLEPAGEWMIGVAMLHVRPPSASGIILPNAPKSSSRCFLIEEVSVKAHEAGYRPGDIVIAKSVFDLLLYGGVYHRVMIDLRENNVITRVLGAHLDEFTGLDGKPIVDSLPASFLVEDVTRSGTPQADTLPAAAS